MTRLWFAWVCLVRVLFDPMFAARAWLARTATVSLPVAPVPAAAAPLALERSNHIAPHKTEGTPQALQLLALLQREGRLVDFLEQEITTFSDEEVGAAARIVHEGCRKTLHRVASVKPVRAESEGANITLPSGFAPSEVKLIGDVRGSPPYRGTLRHRGWRATGLELPEVVDGHDASILAPAEVEL